MKVHELEAYAWVGEDERGSGELGIKNAVVPAGNIPIVAIERDKIDQPYIVRQLQAQSDKYGKTIYFVKLKFEQVEKVLKPQTTGN